jgi:hypothetical protein
MPLRITPVGTPSVSSTSAGPTRETLPEATSRGLDVRTSSRGLLVLARESRRIVTAVVGVRRRRRDVAFIIGHTSPRPYADSARSRRFTQWRSAVRAGAPQADSYIGAVNLNTGTIPAACADGTSGTRNASRLLHTPIASSTTRAES